MFSRTDDPNFWYLRAEEVRALAEELEDDARRTLMLRIADDYDLLVGLTMPMGRLPDGGSVEDSFRQSQKVED